MSVVIAVLLFGFMIFFHELGHFATAKWAGVKVNEFSIGMGPQIFSKTVGETAYSLRLLPIGGFVAMEGEDEESDDDRRFMACPVWKRIIITSAGAIMNLILGFAVVMVLTCGQPLLGTTTVASFSEGASSANYLMAGDTILAVNEEKAGCDYAVDIFYRYGTDGNAAMRGGNNLRAAAFGMAVYCSHGMERTHIEGLRNTMNLLLAYVLDI